MPRKKIVKSRKIVKSNDDAVLCVAWVMECLFENVENYLKKHSISGSQAECMDLQAVAGEKLVVEDENIPIGGELQRLKHRWLCLLWQKPSLALSDEQILKRLKMVD